MTDCLEYKGNTFYFHTGERQTARELVLKYHYSGRCHENPILVGSLHFGGGGTRNDLEKPFKNCVKGAPVVGATLTRFLKGFLNNLECH